MMSLVETLVNVAVGFLISLMSQIVIFHAYDVRLSLGDNVAITLWFTVISVVRSYTIRRVFNQWRQKNANQST